MKWFEKIKITLTVIMLIGVFVAIAVAQGHVEYLIAPLAIIFYIFMFMFFLLAYFVAPNSAYFIYCCCLMSGVGFFFGQATFINKYSEIPEKSNLTKYEGRLFIDLDRANGGVGSGRYWRLVDDTKNASYDFICPGRISRPCALIVGNNYQRFVNQPIKIWAQGKLAWEIEIAGEIVESYERNKKYVTTPNSVDYVIFYAAVLALLIGTGLVFWNRKELRAFLFSPFVWRKTHMQNR